MTQAAYELDPIQTLAALIDREATEPTDSLPNDLEVPAGLFQKALFQPLREAALRPGKELRGRLVGIAWRFCGGLGSVPPELAACVEALHLGSLIVDDIEDGSPRRRGGPALHQVVGLPLALNAGNWLYFFPTVLVSRLALPPGLELALRVALDRAVLRCHYGQALDLSVRVTELRQREVAQVVAATTRLKTGSLMELAAELGAIAAAASKPELAALTTLGREIGIALQMLDDLTGITSRRRSHKGHEDLVEARPSWVWAWLAECEDDVSYLRLRALEEQVFRREVPPEAVATLLRERIAERGRLAIRDTLKRVGETSQAILGEERALSELHDELARLETYDG